MTTLSDNPQAMFGVLVALECGMSPVVVAARLGQGLRKLERAVDAAREGLLPREPAVEGRRMVYDDLADLDAPETRQVLMKHWMRRAVRMLVAHGQVPVEDLRDPMAERHGLKERLDELRTELGRLGVSLTRPAGAAHFVVTPEARARLGVIVKAGWKVPA